MLKEIIGPIIENSRFEPIQKVETDIVRMLLAEGFAENDIKVKVTQTSGCVTVRHNNRINMWRF